MTSDLRERWRALLRWLRGEGSPNGVQATMAGTIAREDARRRMIALFRRLRAAQFNLGLAELLDALELFDGGWNAESLAEWQIDLRLLWCHDLSEVESFDELWREVWLSQPRQPKNKPEENKPAEPDDAKAEQRQSDDKPKAPAAESAVVEPAMLPVQPFEPALEEVRDEATLRWPLARRVMAYGWRHLRAPLSDGPADVVDVAETISQTARQGFFLAPAYRRRLRSHAHLILLVDQGGSMTPFHRFARDLVETAFEQIADAPVDSASDEEGAARVEVYYFHNQMGDTLHRDPRLTMPIAVDQALARCDSESCILVVSDAGAARGVRRRERIRASSSMIALLQQRTALVAWLNPMPETRWRGASAEVIAQFTRMFQMTPDGFGNAIDALRGLS